MVKLEAAGVRALCCVIIVFSMSWCSSARSGSETWPTSVLNWGDSPWRSAPIDLSFLNEGEKPAGKHGFLKAAGNQLKFEDGTVVRFWGTNLTAQAIFGPASQDDVKIQAKRLSRLGFNLVRFHHHDSYWVKPNIFGESDKPDTKSLSPMMMEKLDWWIKCLKDEGIYIWLDLEVQRQLKREDGIAEFDEISKGNAAVQIKGYNFVNPSIELAMQKFNEEYLNHFNKFTGLRYIDDPAIAIVLITNENDLTHHFASRLLPDKDVPWHAARYLAEASAFAEKYGFPKNKVWRSWETGVPQLFLNDLEHRFDIRMIRHLRDLGLKVPIVTTSLWGGDPLSSLPALTTGNLIDVHSYGRFGELSQNPLKETNLVEAIAAAHVVNMPISVSEWNVEPFPVSDRDVLPLYLSASASMQGWNAMMQYAYSQEPVTNRGRPSNWQAFNDPALMSMLPAAALLYRRGDVKEAATTYVFAPNTAQLFGKFLSPENAVALRTAAERGKLLIDLPPTTELPWIKRTQISSAANLITDPDRSLIQSEAEEQASDNGELNRNWKHGIYTINTPRSQAALGNIGDNAIKLADVEFEIVTANAAVAVQSLDDRSIKDSASILISLGANSVPESKSELPFHSEPVIGQLSIRARPGMKLYPQREGDTPATGIDMQYKDGWYGISLDSGLGTYWAILKQRSREKSGLGR